MKCLLVNDTYGWYHFGCYGTSFAIKKELEQLGAQVESVPIWECMQLRGTPKRADDFFDERYLEAFKEGNPRIYALICDSEVVVVNGEGTLHGVNQGPINLLYIMYLSKILGKNVQVINHSVFPDDRISTVISSEEARLYKHVYELIDHVMVREPRSFYITKALGLRAEESFDCLPLYIKKYYEHGKVKKDPGHILISGSAAWMGVNIFTKKALVDKNLLNGFNQMLGVMCDQVNKGYRVSFLYSDHPNGSLDDRDMYSYIRSKTHGKIGIYGVTTMDAWLSCIEGAGLLVSGRFHHSIAAACLGTKFVSLNSNTPKVTGLMETLGQRDPLLFSDPNLRANLERRMSTVEPMDALSTMEFLCRKAQENFKYIPRLISKLR